MLASACQNTRLRAGAHLPENIDSWLKQSTSGNVPTLALSPVVLACPDGKVTVRAMPEVAGAAAWLLLVTSTSTISRLVARVRQPIISDDGKGHGCDAR